MSERSSRILTIDPLINLHNRETGVLEEVGAIVLNVCCNLHFREIDLGRG